MTKTMMKVTHKISTLVEVPSDLSEAMKTDVAIRMVGRGLGMKGVDGISTEEIKYDEEEKIAKMDEERLKEDK